MKLNKVDIVNFRNYASCSLDFSAMTNVLYGQNAQGKTNLLEAVFYAAFGMSHRTNAEEDLLKIDCSEMAVGIAYTDFSGSHAIRIKKYRQNGKNKKDILLDGIKVRPKEHYGSFNAVMFSPEDLQLIKGEPALRRRFLDMQIAQTDRVYYDLLVKYNRILQQRNKFLKSVRDSQSGSYRAVLQVWNKEFAALAAAIMQKRLQALKKVAAIIMHNYAAIAGNNENMSLKYEIKGNDGAVLYPEDDLKNWDEFYSSSLAEREKVDILRGNTGIGPHRDDIVFLLDGRVMKSFGSQGQQRSGALAVKLSQLEYVQQETGEYPVLLLDDVMSELDAQRREKMLLFIDGRVQTFITVNDRELIPDLAGCSYFEVTGGNIRKA